MLTLFAKCVFILYLYLYLQTHFPLISTYGIFGYFHLFAHLNYQYRDQCMKDKIVK